VARAFRWLCRVLVTVLLYNCPLRTAAAPDAARGHCCLAHYCQRGLSGAWDRVRGHVAGQPTEACEQTGGRTSGGPRHSARSRFDRRRQCLSPRTPTPRPFSVPISIPIRSLPPSFRMNVQGFVQVVQDRSPRAADANTSADGGDWRLIVCDGENYMDLDGLIALDMASPGTVFGDVPPNGGDDPDAADETLSITSGSAARDGSDGDRCALAEVGDGNADDADWSDVDEVEDADDAEDADEQDGWDGMDDDYEENWSDENEADCLDENDGEYEENLTDEYEGNWPDENDDDWSDETGADRSDGSDNGRDHRSHGYEGTSRSFY